MSEAKFTAEFKESIKKLYPNSVYQKHSDRFTKGVGDAEIVDAGMSYWFEIKCRLGKGGSLVGQASHQFKPLQIKYLTDRIKAGIKGYGLAQLDRDVAVMIPGNLINQFKDVNRIELIEKFGIVRHKYWDIKLK